MLGIPQKGRLEKRKRREGKEAGGSLDFISKGNTHSPFAQLPVSVATISEWGLFYVLYSNL